MAWKNKLTDRELKEIAFATTYSEDFAHGTTGHNQLMLIAKMAKMLDEMERCPIQSECYIDRNLLALLAGRLATRCNLNAGLFVDPEAPEWPVLVIDLPTGQVSWHIDVNQIQGMWASYSPGPFVTMFQAAHLGWDGHTSEEKRKRVIEYIQ